jgi:hypothetical protein
MVGHFLEVCKRYNGTEEDVKIKEPKNKGKNKNESTMKYVQTKDDKAEKPKDTAVAPVVDTVTCKSHAAIVGNSNDIAITSPSKSPVINELDKNTENIVVPSVRID